MRTVQCALVCVIALWATAYGSADSQNSTWAVNHSYATECAEIDNVCVALHADYQLNQFTVIATHPQYWIEPCDFPCTPDWRNCSASVPSGGIAVPDNCMKLWDDGMTVVELCEVADWWRGRDRHMLVEVPGNSGRGHYVRIYRKISGAETWPQVFVLYADGNVRIKPQPAGHMPDVCFGSSVIIGPATLGTRPFVDVMHVVIDPYMSTLQITYDDGSEAAIALTATRGSTELMVQISYTTDEQRPFAIFRSMFVEEGNADADSVRAGEITVPILAGWDQLPGTAWFFHRAIRSIHNTSAPDIAIVVSHDHVVCPPATELGLPRDVSMILTATLNGFGAMVKPRWPFPVDRVNAGSLEPTATGFSMTELGLALLALVCERDLQDQGYLSGSARDIAAEAAELLAQAASLPRPVVSRLLENGDVVRARFFHSFYSASGEGYVPGPGLGALDNANLAVALAIVSEAFPETDAALAAVDLLDEMDFRFFLTPDETALALGYFPEGDEYETWAIGQWGSEGILAVIMSMANDGLEASHLLRLAHASPPVHWEFDETTGVTVPAYAGGMWVKLFPLLLISSEDLDPRFLEDARQYARAHIFKGRELLLPFWGWSPCSLVVGDYGEFGVSEVAQHGLPAMDLITPYATFLVLGVLGGYPPATEEVALALDNLAAIAAVPCAFDMSRGFADCVDLASWSACPSLLSLDKGIELVSIYNYVRSAAGLPGIGSYLWSYFGTLGMEEYIRQAFEDAGDVLFGGR